MRGRCLRYPSVLRSGTPARRSADLRAPERTAQLYAKDPARWRAARNRILQQIEAQGRSAWRVRSGSTRQSIAEKTNVRFKTLFGWRLWARHLATQHTEARVKCMVLNRMTQLDMPEAVRKG